MKEPNPNRRLFLLGAGGHGRVVADMAEVLGWRDIAFLDGLWPKLKRSLIWPVVGTFDDLPLAEASPCHVCATMGNNRTRLAVHRKLVRTGFVAPSLIHPSAVVSPHASVGSGTVVMPNAVINAGAVIGDAVIVNTGATVDHDCQLGDGVHVSPGAHIAGEVVIGEASWIGIGAVVRETVSIGRGVTVGAGAAVIFHIADEQLVTGVPARRKTRD
ncbi:MAG: acetyltransferase [Mesorhizobium sp.]|uniref:acetyltransferase n=1 Tax=Mesorhizobium sp. TaxID=1871066 RepID=UPI000FE59A53|nr:acetyltransferase [Mesorhizobium sp.]RWP10334.1 MAG: acetyltransferase [Mesorhizobium sp.]